MAAINSCSTLLYVATEKLWLAQKCRDVFDDIKDSILEPIFSPPSPADKNGATVENDGVRPLPAAAKWHVLRPGVAGVKPLMSGVMDQQRCQGEMLHHGSNPTENFVRADEEFTIDNLHSSLHASTSTCDVQRDIGEANTGPTFGTSLAPTILDSWEQGFNSWPNECVTFDFESTDYLDPSFGVAASHHGAAKNGWFS
jgi:hypothetical protein